jgi:hypothetical protein
MLHNFRTASRTAAEQKEALTALNNDFIKLMEQGGVSAIKAQPEFQMKAATLIREVVADQFAMWDPTPIFTERRDARLGDKIEFAKKHNTLRVVRYAPQSQPLMYSPVKSKYTITTSSYELPYGIELIKILTRQFEIADFAQHAAQAMVRHSVDLVLTAINTACASGQNDIRGRALRTMAAGSDVTQAELNAAIRRMGPGTTIFGQRYALDPIFTFAGAQSLQTQEELHQRGVVGTYRGCNLVAVVDDYNEYITSFTKIGGKDIEKLLFLAGAEKGATLLERDLSPLNWEELDAEKALFRSSLRFDHGVFVDRPYLYHVIELV